MEDYSNWSSESLRFRSKSCYLNLVPRVILTEHLKKCGDKAKDQLRWLLEIESRPFTLNTHYYSNYKDKFLAFYRGSRQSGANGDLIRNLQLYDSVQEANPFQEGVRQLMSALPQIGITGTQPEDIAKLLAPDPMEPALAIMAGVRAYFQGKCNRLLTSVETAAHPDF